MTESQSPSREEEQTSQNNKLPDNIPLEIISDEEMALIEASFAAATRSLISSPSRAHFQNNVRSMTLLSKRSFSGCGSQNDPLVADVEDSGRFQKRNRVIDSSLLHRFRRKRGLSVTDITATEWCEKKMEYTLLCGKPEKTKAMKAGSIRHEALEEEVIKKVKVHVSSAEDVWALKFLNFIVGANQLLFDGLTRELPLVGFSQGVWMVGIIDEIRMPKGQSDAYPMLVDTKTRVGASLPAEPQRRNGRYELQEDQSLLGEDQFEYDLDWVKGQIKSSLEVWRGEREASYTPEDERWKCRSCKFASECPASNSGSPRRKDSES
ncbi:hypothetical protein RND71_020981 [Anisodus tanguticus]|uniref:Exonuclease V n=1 Tax=Anisodus tanguticus TaxID=243964 RepID=A0AAE1RWF3_9SOLA|nr:hypothetical protein RND71_020981 [Anisodus tanguticus]